MVLFELLEKGIWAGLAAMGFAFLFNVPLRTLFPVWILGALGGLTKYYCLSIDLNIILASFVGASLIGVLSVPLAHKVHAPPMIFSIPAIIPMIPGAFAYRMMMGLISLSVSKPGIDMSTVLVETFQNGMKVAFILLSLAVGVAVPMLIARKDSAKRIRIKL